MMRRRSRPRVVSRVRERLLTGGVATAFFVLFAMILAAGHRSL